LICSTFEDLLITFFGEAMVAMDSGFKAYVEEFGQFKSSSVLELPVFMTCSNFGSDESESDSDVDSSYQGAIKETRSLDDLPVIQCMDEPSLDTEHKCEVHEPQNGTVMAIAAAQQLDDDTTDGNGSPAPKVSGSTLEKDDSGKRAEALLKLSNAVALVKQEMQLTQIKHQRMRRSRQRSSEIKHHQDKSCAPCVSSTPVCIDKPDIKHVAQKVIIFDWDDTLLPTSFVEEVLEPCGVNEVTPSSPFHAGMRQHAKAIESVLRAASAVAHVAIVTLAQRPWVNTSAARFLPGLHIEELVRELNIPVYYAMEHVSVATSYVEEEEMDLHVVAKHNAMNKFIKKVSRKGGEVSHIMSIGDSHAEAEALKELVWSTLDNSNATTVRLLKSPSLQELTDELGFLAQACPQLVCKEGDADFHLGNSEDVDVIASQIVA